MKIPPVIVVVADGDGREFQRADVLDLKVHTLRATEVVDSSVDGLVGGSSKSTHQRQQPDKPLQGEKEKVVRGIDTSSQSRNHTYNFKVVLVLLFSTSVMFLTVICMQVFTTVFKLVMIYFSVTLRH